MYDTIFWRSVQDDSVACDLTVLFDFSQANDTIIVYDLGLTEEQVPTLRIRL